jgi:LCP family protein required for cell wall assembly
MIRRGLIGLSATAFVLGACVLVLTVWLGGRPFAEASHRGPTVVDGPVPGDLIAPSSASIDGPSTLGDVRQPASPVPVTLPFPIVRTENKATPSLRWTLNVLLVGLDRRPGVTGGGRTDTILLAVMDRTSDHVGMVSIPRDLYVEIPDHGPARINAAYGIGQRQRRDGMKVLRRVVEDTLSIPIHHDIAVDLDGFERAIDALGGVTVDVTCPIEDNFLDSREPSGRRRLSLDAGPQHMDGRTAAMYVRSRHGRSDWDRARRQQALLLGMKARLLSVGGMSRGFAVWDELGESIRTDMTRMEMLGLAQRAAQVDPRHIHGLVLGHEHTEHWATPEGSWVLLPRFEAIDGALANLFSAPSPGARPGGARCPAADVALTRPDRRAVRVRVRELQGVSSAPPSVDAGSNSDHSSSFDREP